MSRREVAVAGFGRAFERPPEQTGGSPESEDTNLSRDSEHVTQVGHLLLIIRRAAAGALLGVVAGACALWQPKQSARMRSLNRYEQ